MLGEFGDDGVEECRADALDQARREGAAHRVQGGGQGRVRVQSVAAYCGPWAGCWHQVPVRHGLSWICQSEQDTPAPVRSFVGFLRQDLDSVTTGLILEWSSGKV